MDNYDLIIVGGGPVAGILAALLADTPWKIAVVAPGQPTAGSRAIALNHSSRQTLQSLNLWQALAGHTGKIRKIEVSRRGEPGKTHLSAADINTAELGWVIPEKQLMTAISARLSTLSNLTSIPATPLSIDQQENSITLELDTATSISARLAIGADGAASKLRQLAGLKFNEHDFHSVAICASMTVTQPHQNQAWERFTNSGPIALLPLADSHLYSLVWCVDARDTDDLLGCSNSDFLNRLQQQFGYAAGRFTAAIDRTAYPLVQRTCQRPTADRLLLIGSAARHLHPVGGQGLNLALRDVVVLTEILKQAAREVGDPGNPLLLQQYCDQRKVDWRTTERFSGQLPGLFAEHRQPLTLSRNLALTALELIPPLRRAFVRRAAGQFGFRPLNR